MPPKRTLTLPNREGSIALADCVFPEEIMLCILTRLPVKSIIRFSSVCKPWGDLFSTREFMKMHQVQYSSDPNNESIIIHNYTEKMSVIEIESDETELAILDYPHPRARHMEIVGCINGLLCLSSPHLGPDNIVLWNPAMKLFKFVRISENENFKDTETVSLGFGYDAEGGDYKVVRIVCFPEKEVDDVVLFVEVYSVNTDSWITIEPGFKFRVFFTTNTVIANGNPYWIAEIEEGDGSISDISKFLVCFDVRRMAFKTVPIYSRNLDSDTEHETLMDWKVSLGSLVCSRDSDNRTETLMDWKGSLGFLVCSRGSDNRAEPLHVMVFDDDDRIWRKVHTFVPTGVDAGIVLKCSKNGKMLCYRDDKLFVFDPETGWVKVYETTTPYPMIHQHLYIERLTCIKGMESSKMIRRKRKFISGRALAINEDV